LKRITVNTGSIVKQLFLNDALANNIIFSVNNCFSTALNLKVNPQPWVLLSGPLKGDYAGSMRFIDYKEKVCAASMSILFSEPVIKYILKNVYGDEVNKVNSEVKFLLKDGVSEITNMICTNVKSALNAEGYSFCMLLPSVIEGKDHVISRNTNKKSLRIPFLTDSYEFSVDVIADENTDSLLPDEMQELERLMLCYGKSN